MEEAAPAGTCHWHAAGSRLSVTLRFARPVVPAWRPPPPPPKPLLELIPPRDLTPKPPPTTAADELKAKVRAWGAWAAASRRRSSPVGGKDIRRCNTNNRSRGACSDVKHPTAG